MAEGLCDRWTWNDEEECWEILVGSFHVWIYPPDAPGVSGFELWSDVGWHADFPTLVGAKRDAIRGMRLFGEWLDAHPENDIRLEDGRSIYTFDLDALARLEAELEPDPRQGWLFAAGEGREPVRDEVEMALLAIGDAEEVQGG